MKAAVTGGAGFIGSHLVDNLISAGHEVVVVDNLATGRLANLGAHASNPRFTMHVHDISTLDEQVALQGIFEDVDWVFHLAALADIVPSIQYPIAYHRANVDGTVAVLEAARNANVKRLVYAASSSCYGIPDVVPTPESAPLRPQYPYALSKYVGEQYVQHWGQVYRMPAVSLRFFNVFGPRSRTSGTYGAVFGVFLAQKLAGKPFTVVGDGTQSRDFTYVSDVVRAMVAAAESDLQWGIFNVGSGGTYTVNQLVELLGGETVFLPKRPGEPDCTHADISLIRDHLGWEPQTPFEVGVRVMLEQIELWSDAPVWDTDSIAKATDDWFKYLSR